MVTTSASKSMKSRLMKAVKMERLALKAEAKCRVTRIAEARIALGGQRGNCSRNEMTVANEALTDRTRLNRAPAMPEERTRPRTGL